ncbi:uncharacterized protein LOC128545903 [Mercenaria mercenaria]|uniref:uncharacterized protein LOC128545903 n=1 Tax=Mercenaria mercenaria TaxID=6596 RepID=UPI001E1DB0E2|nr:uncharacterized protein LOC128545903 [Mercenaria mercenaria]
MGSAIIICAELVLCCLIFPTLILQTVGLFTAHWVSNSTCDSIGVIYSCCSGQDNNTCKNTNGGDELDARVLGLEVTACAMMMVALAMTIFGIWFECQDDEDEDSECANLVVVCGLIFAGAGILSFVGCMIIVGNFSPSQLGWSFYLCLVSGSFIILLIVLLLIYVLKEFVGCIYR